MTIPTPNPLFSHAPTKEFAKMLRQTFDNQTPNSEGPLFKHVAALNTHYLDSVMVLILEAVKDVLQHPNIQGVSLNYKPLCESNHDEMVVLFRFALLIDHAPYSNLGYDEAFVASSLEKALPMLSSSNLEALVPLLQNLVTFCENVDPGLWNDFSMEYDIHHKWFQSASDVDLVYNDNPHLLDLKNQMDRFVIAQTLPQNVPSLPAKKM